MTDNGYACLAMNIARVTPLLGFLMLNGCKDLPQWNDPLPRYEPSQGLNSSTQDAAQNGAVILKSSDAPKPYSERSQPVRNGLVGLNPAVIDEAKAKSILQPNELILNAIPADRRTSWNYQVTPIAEIAKAISNQGNIIIDSAEVEPGDKVTFVLENIPTRSMLIEFAKVILNKGYRIESNAGKYRIVRDTQIQAVRKGTGIIKPTHLSLESLYSFLKQGFPNLDVQKLEKERVISLAGTPEQVGLATELAAALDERLTGKAGVALITVKNASAVELAREAQELASQARPESEISLIPLARANSILAVSRDDADLAWITSWVHKIDYGAPLDLSVRTFPILNRDADTVSDILIGLFDEQKQRDNPNQNGKVERSPIDSASMSNPGTNFNSNRSSSTPRGLENPTSVNLNESPSTQLRPSSATSSAPLLNQLTQTSGGPHISSDRLRNTVIVSAPPEQMKSIDAIIASLDKPGRQVFLQAAIIEITLSDQLQFGPDLFIPGANASAAIAAGQNGQSGSFSISSALNTAISPRTVAGGLGLVLNTSNLKAIITAIHEKSNTNLLSAPRLLVAENETGLIQVGDKVPILVQQQTSAQTNPPVVSNSIAYVDTGIILKVKARIGSESAVTLSIDQEAATPIQTLTSNIDSPTIQERRMVTTVTIGSGQTIALGGLMRTSREVTKTGIPFVENIPLLGNVLTGRDNVEKRTELLILITPKIIEQSEQILELSNAFRRSLDDILSKQGAIDTTPTKGTSTTRGDE